MREDLDDRIHDAVALDEISLYGDVLSAVAGADRPLTDDEIDAVLGARPASGLVGASSSCRVHHVGAPVAESESPRTSR